MEQFLAWATDNWLALTPVIGAVLTALASLIGKAGRIGWVLANVAKRLADGKFTDQEKVDTMNDIISIFKGWWFNKSKIGA